MSHPTLISRRSALAAAVLPFAWWTGARAEEQALSLGYAAINEYSGLYVGIDKGLFRKRGLDVQATLLPTVSTMPAALASGSLQIATPSISNILQATDGGLDLQIICGAAYLSPSKPNVDIVVAAGGPVNAAADLAGKRVGVPGLNALYHVIFRRWMSQNGLSPQAVQFVETPYPQMYDLLRGNQVDAVLAADPVRTRILGDQVGRKLGNMLSAVPEGALSGAYSTSASYAKAHPETLRAFRETIAEAHVFAQAEPAETLEIASRYLKLPVETVSKLPAPLLRAEVDPAQLAFWAQVARDQGMLRRPIKVEQLLATQP